MGIAEGSSFGVKVGKIRMTSCPSQSAWFSDNMRGVEDRMGYETRANKAVPIGAIVEMLDMIKEDAETAPTLEEANELWKLGACVAVATAGSLRGHEVFYTDLASMRKHLHLGRNGRMPRDPTKETDLDKAPHVMLCLMGKFKGETGHRYHMIGLASETKSGIAVRWWIEQLIRARAREGHVKGPAFGTKDGKLASQATYDEGFRHYLKRVQKETSGLISPDEDIDAYYGLSRTPRKSAQQRARNANLGSDVQDAMNRWRTIESAGARKPRMKMRDHYSDARYMLPVTWRYSYVQ